MSKFFSGLFSLVSYHSRNRKPTILDVYVMHKIITVAGISKRHEGYCTVIMLHERQSFVYFAGKNASRSRKILSRLNNNKEICVQARTCLILFSLGAHADLNIFL